MKMMVLRCDLGRYADAMSSWSLFMQFSNHMRATRERASASVMRANDGSAMRKWMGFQSQRGIYGDRKIVPHANLPIFSFLTLLATAVFSPTIMRYGYFFSLRFDGFCFKRQHHFVYKSFVYPRSRPGG